MSVRAGFLFMAAILVADIVTKAMIDGSMTLGQSIPVIEGFFSLSYVRNPGGAFGLFSSLGEPWGKVFFISAATFTVVFLAWFIRELPESERVHRAAVFAVIAGAIGNMIDRVVYGEVVDFLDFYLGSSHWPAFNIADTAITVGVTLLVYLSFFGAKDPRGSGAVLLLVLSFGVNACTAGGLGRPSPPAPAATPSIPAPSTEGGVVVPEHDTAFGRLLERLSDPDAGADAGASVGPSQVVMPPRISRRNQPLISALQATKIEAFESERGVVVTLRDVVFEFGSDELTFGARRKMRQISDVIEREAKGRSVSVEGHTDAIGPTDYNQNLSERRAAAVAVQLALDGVPDALMVSHGFGEIRPVAPNIFDDGSDNPSGRARNRRVEIVIQN